MERCGAFRTTQARIASPWAACSSSSGVCSNTLRRDTAFSPCTVPERGQHPGTHSHHLHSCPRRDASAYARNVQSLIALIALLETAASALTFERSLSSLIGGMAPVAGAGSGEVLA